MDPSKSDMLYFFIVSVLVSELRFVLGYIFYLKYLKRKERLSGLEESFERSERQ